MSNTVSLEQAKKKRDLMDALDKMKVDLMSEHDRRDIVDKKNEAHFAAKQRL